MPSNVPSGRKIEIVADSTATGYGIEGPDQYCGFSADTENHYIAYPALAARAVNAEVNTIGWSGIGVFRDNDCTLKVGIGFFELGLHFARIEVPG